MRAGVCGSPITHSLSPVLHQAAYADLGLDIDYTKIEADVSDLPGLLGSLDENWLGLSVTMPLKQAIISHLDMCDGLAKTVGAVNTVCVQPMGSAPMLVGFNTDVEGIVLACREQGELSFPSALILGSRATASSALAATVQLKATSVTLAARNHGGPGSAYAAASRMKLNPSLMKFDLPAIARALPRTGLLVSTVPAGVADDLADLIEETAPDLSSLMILDVVYAPWPSRLVSACVARGARCVPGWTMLLHQAAAQVRLFTGSTPNVKVMREALESALEV